MKQKTISLSAALHKISVKWASIGLLLSAVVSTVILLYGTRLSTELRAKSLSESLSRSFRPQLLSGDVRDAQFQMMEVTKENVIILDVAGKQMYSVPEHPQSLPCKPNVGLCWDRKNLLSLTVFEPIYFDAERKNLWGYLTLTLPMVVEWELIGFLFVGILFLFSLQAWGLLSALSQISKQITEPIASFTKKIISPDSHEQLTETPFSELIPMKEAIGQLQSTIHDLELQTASQAKRNAQTNIVRQLGHDLKTPLSQASKLLAVIEAQSTEKNNVEVVSMMKDSFKVMGDLIRQMKDLREEVKNDSIKNYSKIAPLELCFEVKKIASGLQRVHAAQNIQFELLESLTVDQIYAHIEKTALFQIMDNFISNAIDAIGTRNQGTISILLRNVDGHAELSISDNGHGIPFELQGRIFDLDFTTKKGRGTGLGLASVQHICSEVGARLHFESIVNQGTSFFIKFPKVNRPFSEKLSEVSI